jgi:hypothetical protein
MSVEKAKEFIEAVTSDDKLKEKMEGFDFEDLKAAAKEMQDSEAPGGCFCHW